jgi:uncharacterized protein
MYLKRLLWGIITMTAMMSSVHAQQYLRIGTGGTAGTYFPVGVLVAKLVSQPDMIVATAQPSNGSLGNVIGVASGSLESGFSQADVATWAYSGTGIFVGKPRLPGLRLIANLYPESIHVVVKRGSGVKTIADLKGKRVALDEAGSGSLISAKQVLDAYGLKETDLLAEYIKPKEASEKLKSGALDAFFLTAGTPAKAIEDLAASGFPVELLAIDGSAAARLLAASPFLITDTISAGTYSGTPAVQTLAVGAQWVVNETVSDELIYQVTKALYSPEAQNALARGHAKGKLITLANAVKRINIPLHSGARRYYQEAGVLK